MSEQKIALYLGLKEYFKSIKVYETYIKISDMGELKRDSQQSLGNWNHHKQFIKQHGMSLKE